MQKKIYSLGLLSLGIGMFLAVGCDKQNAAAPTDAKPAASAQAATPAGFLLEKAPDDAKDLLAVKSAGPKNGDEVVVRAIVAGSEHPFVGNRAVVQVIDPSATTCDKMPGDSCKTPWDICCNPGEAKTKGATVQLVDAGGAPLKGTLEGVGGMKPMSQIVIKGKARMEGEAMVIDATALHVKP